ncbi:2-oxoglutarate and iron-dependent oxygenase domain-containing protein 3-like [Oscarella lobularis]|uniref:2-oxoglutarate and iron-dependent oxygenase domain-containing protein 3-like n=1 Tax=Oscarella lobularis TaxID=121494 RepID=UPI00331368E7
MKRKQFQVKDAGEERKQNGDKSPKISFWRRMLFRFLLIAIAVYIVRSRMPRETSTLAYSREKVEKRTFDVPCSTDYDKKYKGCTPARCGRVIMDRLIEPNEISSLKALLQKGMSLGGSSGGPTILDLHSGALTKGDKFVDVYKLAEAEGISPIFTAEDQEVYRNVKEKIKKAIGKAFGVDQSLLYLTKPTFFSRMTSLPAKTLHDQYWHPHVDKVTYGSFYYTSLLYLSDYDKDFTGGRFIFVDSGGNKTVEPATGRVSFFTSGSENVHRVEKVMSGTRFALTVAFTCEKNQAISEPKRR